MLKRDKVETETRTTAKNNQRDILSILASFESLDIGLVLQETKVFSESPLKARKCELVLAKLLYLIYQGHVLSEKDATSVFFSVIKSFQTKEVLNICLEHY